MLARARLAIFADNPADAVRFVRKVPRGPGAHLHEIAVALVDQGNMAYFEELLIDAGTRA
jgi:hypothetical protein